MTSDLGVPLTPTGRADGCESPSARPLLNDGLGAVLLRATYARMEENQGEYERLNREAHRIILARARRARREAENTQREARRTG